MKAAVYYENGGPEVLKPVWRPRYLAVARGAAPALVLIDATRLISRGLPEDG